MIDTNDEVSRLRDRVAQLEVELQRTVSAAIVDKKLFFDAVSAIGGSLDSEVLVNCGGTIVQLNDRAGAMFGYRPDELIGRPIEALVPDHSRAAHSVHRTSYFQNPEIRLVGIGKDLRGLRKDSSQFPVEIVLKPHRNGNELFVIATIADITERKRGEEAIRRLAAIVESSDDAILGKDLNGTITSWNRGAEKIFGYTADEMIGQSVFKLIPEEYVDEEHRILQKIRLGEKVDHYETVRLRNDGSPINISLSVSPIHDLKGQVIGASKVARDITDRMSAEERFRRVVDLAPNAMVMIDESGTIVLINTQAERTFNYSRDELAGQSIERLVPERIRSLHRLEREQFFANPIARPMGVSQNLWARRRDGTEFPVEIGLTPISNGNQRYVMAAVVDITERLQAQETSRIHLIELAHAARLSAVGEMFSELAHEINQPLGAAANYLRACLRTIRSGESYTIAQLEGWLEKAIAQSVRATEIVQRLGSYVKKGDTVPAELDINDLIKDVMSLPVLEVWSSRSVQRVTPQLELAQNLPRVLADRVQIEQVMLNLIRNAMESMAESSVSDRRLIVGTRLENHHVAVSVRDFGCGMSPDQVRRLFTPFYTTKKTGMGLGLSISKSIIDAHAGTFSVDSQLGIGTTFCFTLPTIQAEDL